MKRYGKTLLITLLILVGLYAAGRGLLLYRNYRFAQSLERLAKERNPSPRPTRIPLASTVIDSARTADSSLTEVVKRSVSILDTVNTVRDSVYYKLSVAVDMTADFTPVGVEFIASDTGDSITVAQLVQSKSSLSCWNGSSLYRMDDKRSYQTENITEQWVRTYAPVWAQDYKTRKLNLYVQKGMEVFLVEGLTVSKICSMSIVD